MHHPGLSGLNKQGPDSMIGFESGRVISSRASTGSVMNRFLLLFVIFLACLSWLTPARAMLVNGGAEAGDTSGWTASGGNVVATVGDATFTPFEGSYFFTFAGSAASSGSLTQTGTDGLTEGSVLLLSGYLVTDSVDSGTAILTVYDGVGGVLDTTSTGPQNTAAAWQPFSLSLAVPAGAATWEVRLEGQLGASGSNTDVNWDAIELKKATMITQQPQDVKSAVEWQPADLANTPSSFTPLQVQVTDDITGGAPDTGSTIRFDLPAKGNRRILSDANTGSGPDMSSTWSVVLDESNNRAIVVDAVLPGLFAIDLSTGDRTIFSQSGMAGSGTAFSIPQYLVSDIVNNRLIVSDAGLDALLAVDLSTGDRTVISGAGVGTGLTITTAEGVAVDPVYNRILLAEDSSNLVFAIDPVSGNRTVLSSSSVGTGPAFDVMRTLIVDADNHRLLVGDRDTHRIFAVDLVTGDRSEFTGPSAGSGVTLDYPADMQIDTRNHRLLVPDWNQDAILAVDLTTGNRSILSDNNSGGPDYYTGLGGPWGVALDAASQRLLVVNNPVTTGVVDSLFSVDLRPSVGDRSIVSNTDIGTGIAINHPVYAALDSARDRVLITDTGAGGVLAVDPVTGDRSLFSTNAGPGSGLILVDPQGIEFDTVNDRMLVVDSALAAIVSIDPVTRDRTFLSDFAHGTSATPDADFVTPVQLEFDAIGNMIYVADAGQNAVIAVDPATGNRSVVSKIGAQGSGTAFAQPTGLVLDTVNNRLLVGDQGIDAVFAVDPVSGNRSIIGSTGVFNVLDIEIDAAGNRALVVDSTGDLVYAIDLTTDAESLLASAATGDGILLSFPRAVVLDAERGRALVLDADLDAVLAVDLYDPVLGDTLPATPYTSSPSYSYTLTAGGVGQSFAEWQNSGSTVSQPITLTFDNLPVQLTGLPPGEVVDYMVTHQTLSGTPVSSPVVSGPAFTLVHALTTDLTASSDILDAGQGNQFFIDAIGDAVSTDALVQVNNNATLNTLAQGDLVLTLRGDFTGISAVQATTTGVFTGSDETGSTTGGVADAFLINPGQTAASAVLVSGIAEETIANMDLHFVLDGTTVQTARSFTLEVDVLSATNITAPLDDAAGPDEVARFTQADTDGDGLTDDVEAALGTDPGLADTDGDDLSDFDEVNMDGNPDDYSVGLDTNPNNPDTDGDGVGDGFEVQLGLDPLLPDSPVRVSTDSSGLEGNDDSTTSVMSADGRYLAFQSDADNLVTGDNNSVRDVFIKDLLTGMTTRVSTDSTGVEANGNSQQPSISADGRYVAFRSDATNLVTGDANGAADIFVKDRQTGITTRVSTDSSGVEGNLGSFSAEISADGRYVVFNSDATDLVTGDSNGVEDIFVKDTLTGNTIRVSTDSSGAEGNGDSNGPLISADGRYVVFQSQATDLVTGDGNGVRDVFLKDTLTGSLSRVSTDSSGNEGDGLSTTASMSADGRYVAFSSASANLVTGDGNGAGDVFVKDTQTGITTRASTDSSGLEVPSGGGTPFISDDGRFVAFFSSDNTLVPGDTNTGIGSWDAFVKDTVTGEVAAVDVNSAGQFANGGGNSASGITPDGRYIVLSAYASNLVSDDTNGATDVFRAVNPFWAPPATAAPDTDGDGLDDDIENQLGTNPNYTDSDADGISDFDEVNMDGNPGNYTAGTDTDPNDPDTDGDGFTDFYELNGDGDPTGYAVGIDTDPNDPDTDGDGLTDYEEASFDLDPFTYTAGVDTDALIADTDGDGLQDGFEVLYEGGGGTGTAADYDPYDPATNPSGTDLDANETDSDGDGELDGAEVVFGSDPLDSASQPGSPLRMSTDSIGDQGFGDSLLPVISADGRYVAFVSLADTLVTGDTNGQSDVFVKDRLTGSTTRVSTDSNGVQGNSDSFIPAISADGRYVAFSSLASNLVTGDGAGRDIFLKDTQTGVTTRVSVDTGGGDANSSSFSPAISADGRYVSFHSAASDLVTVDGNGVEDIFVRDTQTGTTVRVSTDSSDTEANGQSILGQISADGRYMAFESTATNLVTGDGNTARDIFVKDTLTGTTIRASTSSSGIEGNGDSFRPVLSADGRYVAFHSDASNLVTGDGNTSTDVFVKDTLTGTTVRVSTDSDGLTEANGSSQYATISADGRYVGFTSSADNLVTGDSNLVDDIFVKDRLSGATWWMSVNGSGTGGDDNSSVTAISADGRYVAFGSDAANLVSGDSNASSDIFRAEIPLDTDGDGLLDAVETNTGIYVSASDTGTDPNNPDTDGDGLNDNVETATGTFVDLSDTGTDPNMADTDTDGVLDGAEIAFGSDPFNVNDVPASPIRVSTANGGVESNYDKFGANISADGRYVAFYSDADDLVPGDNNAANDVFVKDTETGRIELVSTDSNGIPGDAASLAMDISSTGQFVAFESDAGDLVAADANGVRDIFRKDILNGTTIRVSTDTLGSEADGLSGAPVISDDGLMIAFESDATNFIAGGDSNGVTDIFIKDLSAGLPGTTIRVSTDSAGSEATGGPSNQVAMTPDGQVIAFSSGAVNLLGAGNDTNGFKDIFVKDLSGGLPGTTIRVSTDSSGNAANGPSYSPSISADGRYVAFLSNATNLVADDTNNQADIFLKDIQLGTTMRVNVSANGAEADGPTFKPVISADGRFVAFGSNANNLVSGDTNGLDVFIKDVLTGIVTRVSVDSAGNEVSGPSNYPDISFDVGFVAFESLADNLVPNDSGYTDIFRQIYNAPPYTDPNGGVSEGPAGDSYATTFVWDSSGTTPVPVVDSGVQVLDPHSTQLSRIVVSLNNPSAGDQLSINGALQGGITDDGPGTTLTLTGPASITDFEDALSKVVFDITAFSSDYTPREIRATATDAEGIAGNSASITMAILVNGVDLEIDTSQINELVEAGTFTTDIAVINHGTSTTSDVVLSAILPPGATFISASGNGWDCTEINGIVLCSLASLASDSTSTVSLTLTSPPGSGVLTLQTAVASTDTDANAGNESANTQTAVIDYDGGGFQPDGIAAGTFFAGTGYGSSIGVDGEWIAIGQPDTSGDGRVHVMAQSLGSWQTPLKFQDIIAPEAVGNFDDFGFAIAMQDGILAIGAPDVSDALAGKVYIYELDPGGTHWNHVQTLTPSISAAGDEFGYSLALDGNLLAIGAPGGGASFGGNVVLYQRDPNAVSGGWSEQRVFPSVATPTLADWVPRFGHAVALQDSILVIGTPQKDTLDDRGQAFWCRLEGTVCNGFTELFNPHSKVVDQYGQSVAIDGTTIVVGAEYSLEWQSNGAGAAHVYTYNAVSQHYDYSETLTVTNAAGNEDFSRSLSLRDDVLVVGAPGAITAESGGNASGAVFVFHRDGNGEWIERQRIVATDPDDLDAFGQAVAIDGTFVAVGAPGEDTLGTDYGKVYVFTTANEIKLTSPAGGLPEMYGMAVDIDGTTLAVGGSYLDAACSFSCGAVYLYERSGTEWLLDTTIDYTYAGAAEDAEFGSVLALDGNTLLVGAPYDDTVNAADAGAAYVFFRDNGVWSLQQKLHAESLQNAADDRFGAAVGLEGNFAVIGAPDAEAAGGDPLAGSACVFERVGTVWGVPSGMTDNRLLSPDTDSGDRFGSAVTISGNTLVVGAPNAVANLSTGAVDRGIAYTFANNAGDWTFEQKLGGDDGAGSETLPNTQNDAARLGASVAYDSVSGRLVTGVPNGLMAPGTSTTEFPGTAYGFVRPTATSWNVSAVELNNLAEISGTNALDFGSAVAIKNDTAIIGAPGDKHAGVDSGAVFLHQGTAPGVNTWNKLGTLSANDALYGDRYGTAVAIGLDARVVGAPGAPAGTNTGAVYVYPTVSVVTTVKGGVYSSTQTVSFECSDCLKVFYTTDGSTPSQTAGSADPGTLTWDPASPTPFNISAATTLRYFSIDSAFNESTQVTESYIIDTAPPMVGSIDVPADSAMPGPEITGMVPMISGTASDNGGGGILAVQVQIEELDSAGNPTGNYVDLATNTLTATPKWMTASYDVGTGDWDLVVTDDDAAFDSESSYTIHARAIDNGLLISPVVSSDFTYYTDTPAFMELQLTLTSNSILNIPGNPQPGDPDYGKGETDAIVKLTQPGVATEEQQLAGKPIRLVITHPNGVEYDEISDLTVTSEGNLTFQNLGNDSPPYNIDFDIEGAWTIQAFYDGELTRDPAQSQPKTLLVGESAGSAVIVVGRAGGSNEGLKSHTKTALRIYETLLARSFQPEDILFLSPDTDLDGDADSNDGADCELPVDTGDGCNNSLAYHGNNDPNGIDGVPTLVASPTTPGHINVQAAIEGLAPISSNKPAPRYVFFIDHGFTNQFLLTGSETITPTDLATWLDNMENPAVLNSGAETKPTVAVLGMCYAGSFLNAIATSSEGVDRVAISSAWIEESFRGTEENDGVRVGEFFLEEFMKEAGRGASITDAFEYATELTELFTRRSDSTTLDPVFKDLAAQHPLLADTGNFNPADPAPNNDFPDVAGADGEYSRGLFLGVGPNFGTNASDFPADIVDVTDTVFLPAGVTVAPMTLDAANNGGQVSAAWIEVRVPDTSYTPTGLSVQKNPVLIKDALNPPSGGAEPFNHWNVYFTQFSADEVSGSGKNEVFYTVQDISGVISPIRRSVVYVNIQDNDGPSPPVLLSPGDGATIPTTEFFDWEPSTDPEGDLITYTLEISTDPNFDTIDFKIEEIPVSYYFVDESVGLQDLITYYWRVKAIDAFGGGGVGGGSTSAVRSFDTDNSNIVAGGVFVTVSGNALDPVALGNDGVVTAYEAGTSNVINPVAGSQAYQEETTTFYAKYPVDSTGYDFTVSGMEAYGFGTGVTDEPTPISQSTLPTASVALPLAADADGDGLPDAVETNTGIYVDENDTGTDPNDPDTDGDGLDDGVEVTTHGTDPTLRDSDGDGFGDGVEVSAGTNPTVDDGTYPPADGDLAPLNVYDGLVNGADYLVAQRMALGLETQTPLAKAHGDVVTTGASNGVIDTADVLWILQQAQNGP